jgi:alkanesulfonate monooxygenase SsuD/methylene tetrahydromethanopterin reductase-like flavin-dependent oxidoreductase (luciferase family)
MEFAGLSRMHPGRFRPGVALGVRAWLDQLGLLPGRPLTALRDTVEILRALLAGDEVTVDGEVHRLDHVRLDFPPREALPIHLGAVNERALQLSGEIADGTILSVLASPAYVRWARQQIAAGAARSGRDPRNHRVTTFALYAVDDDAERARDSVRAAVTMFREAEATSALLRVPGYTDDELAVAGTPEDCARGLQRLFDAGSDAVCLWLFPTDSPEKVAERTAHEVLPLLRLTEAGSR